MYTKQDYLLINLVTYMYNAKTFLSVQLNINKLLRDSNIVTCFPNKIRHFQSGQKLSDHKLKQI